MLVPLSLALVLLGAAPDLTPDLVPEGACTGGPKGVAGIAKEDVDRCVTAWLAHGGYAAPYADGDLDLDPVHDGGCPMSTKLLRRTYRKLQQSIEATCETRGCEGESFPKQRALEVLWRHAEAHLAIATFPEPDAVARARWSTVLEGRALTDKDLDGLHAVALWKLRNAVYARHGRPFANPDLDFFFYGNGTHAKALDALPLTQNPKYTGAMLSDVDKTNVALIQKRERALRASAPG